jgi:hypothetical protein
VTDPNSTPSDRIHPPVPSIRPEFAAKVRRKAQAVHQGRGWSRPRDRAIPTLLLVAGFFYTAISIERMLLIFGG